MMNRRRCILTLTLMVAALAALLAVDVATGKADVSLSATWAALTGGDVDGSLRTIVVEIRLVKAVMALIVGVALAVSGLQMQTLFRNPLAGPYVLGLSSGASLGVALFMLGAPAAGIALSGTFYWLGTAGAAWLGSACVLMLIAIAAVRLKDIMVVLVMGIMFSSGVSAVVQILQYLSDESSLKEFVVWTMGSLGEVTPGQLPVVGIAVAVGLVLAIATVKSLNLLLLGADYARTMGLDVKRSQWMILASTTLLAGTVTAFCGPIAFVGLAAPHLARMAVADADHRVLMPAAALTGALAMTVCDIVSKLLTLPVNAVTSLLGVPVVMWIIIKSNRR